MKSIEELLKLLSVQEKIMLVEGFDSWMTYPVPRLEIPSAYLTDGPSGVRRQVDEDSSGVMLVSNTKPSTSFPVGINLANTWNTKLAGLMGKAIGREAACYKVDMILGPALNIQRDPRCGRNFEYFSEDPYVAGEMAAAYICGLESEGIFACPKHLAMNNCENYRNISNSVADERAVREIYLKPFEIAVKKGNPHAIMCAYNQINDCFCSENAYLLKEVLRKEWGFTGLTLCDWGAVIHRDQSLTSGLDLDMPGGQLENRERIAHGLQEGTVSMEDLDQSVRRVLRIVEASIKRKEQRRNVSNDAFTLFEEHHNLAVKIACESAVLLKNDGTLPLNPKETVFVTGSFFKHTRYQGGGSSGTNPVVIIDVKSAFDLYGLKYIYRKGFRDTDQVPDPVLEQDALNIAAGCETIVVFCGLDDLTESEGYDRDNMRIPQNQLSLIEKLSALGKKMILVFWGGAPFETDFADGANAILHMFLPGEGGGEACRRLLFGEANPSGKLAQTWVKKESDIPFSDSFKHSKQILYRENIYVGYRFYDMCQERVKYPFGYGLSYTDYRYSNLELSQDDNTITARFCLTNSGRRDGNEIVQLYVRPDFSSKVFRPSKELKAFSKIRLRAGETKEVVLTVEKESLAFYDSMAHRFITEAGKYTFLAGSSSADLPLHESIYIEGETISTSPYSEEVVNCYRNIASEEVPDNVFEESIHRKIPVLADPADFTIESPIENLLAIEGGRSVFEEYMENALSRYQDPDTMEPGEDRDMIIKRIYALKKFRPMMCLRALAQGSAGSLQMEDARRLAEKVNS